MPTFLVTTPDGDDVLAEVAERMLRGLLASDLSPLTTVVPIPEPWCRHDRAPAQGGICECGVRTGGELVTLVVDSELATALGHLVAYQVEDSNADKVLVGPPLAAAAERFYRSARALAQRIPNMTPEDWEAQG